MAKKRQAATKNSRSERSRRAPVAAPAWQGFFSAHAIRETIESIVVAFILAFLFRTFEAEAFVIPTGSMAPTLMGAHKDLACSSCGFRYAAGASSEADDVAMQRGRLRTASDVVAVTCPLCRLQTNVDPRTSEGREYPTYGGDRILVTKFTFEFNEPRRWDVTVFKYPGGAETNYIKRLVGLPGETIRLWHGDLYVKPAEEDAFHLERRPPAKLQAMAQLVYDNNYVVDSMTEKGWPVRWQPWPTSTSKAPGAWSTTDGSRTYEVDGTAGEPQWISYQHFVPSLDDWRMLRRGRLPADYRPRPSLITDFYAYNTSVQRDHPLDQPQMLGLHWVGDLMLECELDVRKAEGQAIFELVKGGRKFRCTLDCQSGQAKLTIDGLDGYSPQAQTAVRGTGSHQVAFANFDNQLWLWVDGSPVEFDGETTYAPLDNEVPRYESQREPGDLMPARIGSAGAALQVSNLRLMRDLYYIATQGGPIVSDYRPPLASLLHMDYQQVVKFWSTPEMWSPPGERSPFDERGEAVFPLSDDQFFVLGDNSPLSQDARLWPAERYVARDLLVGKALYIFWPHSFDKLPGTNIPFPFFPNFSRMEFIR